MEGEREREIEAKRRERMVLWLNVWTTLNSLFETLDVFRLSEFQSSISLIFFLLILALLLTTFCHLISVFPPHRDILSYIYIYTYIFFLPNVASQELNDMLAVRSVSIIMNFPLNSDHSFPSPLLVILPFKGNIKHFFFSVCFLF